MEPRKSPLAISLGRMVRGVLHGVPAALVGTEAMSDRYSLRITERTLEPRKSPCDFADLARYHRVVRDPSECGVHDPDQMRAWVAILCSFDALLEAARAGIRAEVARCGEPPPSLFG